jgi:hypothetical protein
MGVAYGLHFRWQWQTMYYSFMNIGRAPVVLRTIEDCRAAGGSSQFAMKLWVEVHAVRGLQATQHMCLVL